MIRILILSILLPATLVAQTRVTSVAELNAAVRSGADIDASGVVTSGLVIRDVNGLTLRGLKVAGGNSNSPQNEGAALRIENSANVTLVDVTSTGNKNAGASFIKSSNGKVLRCKFTANGGNGLGFVNSTDCLVEDTLIAGNNRGVISPGWAGWGGSQSTYQVGGKWYMVPSFEGGGGKNFQSHRITYRRCWFDDNGGVGAWQDWLNGPHTFEDCWFTGNTNPPGQPAWTGIGLGYEANNGPLVVTRCYFRGNSNSGLAIQESRNATVTDCVFDANPIELRFNGNRIGNNGTGNVLVEDCGFIDCGFKLTVTNTRTDDGIRFRGNTYTRQTDLDAARTKYGETGRVGAVSRPAVSPVGTAPSTQPTTQPVPQPATQTVTDADGVVWSITASGKIARNGTVDPVTNNVEALAVRQGRVWQTAYGLWWSWTGQHWQHEPGGLPAEPTTQPGTQPTTQPNNDGGDELAAWRARAVAAESERDTAKAELQRVRDGLRALIGN